MNSTEQIPVVEASNQAPKTRAASRGTSVAAQTGRIGIFKIHWPEYLMEAGLLGAFMVSACVFGALYEFPHSPVHQAIMSSFLRRLLMGISMGLTAIAIIYSPWGKQSGAHINPSVTLTFLRLGKIKGWDAFFYMASQFTGAVLGVLLVASFLAKQVSDPAVRYVVTTPGPRRTVGSVAGGIRHCGRNDVGRAVFLESSPARRLHRSCSPGLLVATYITIEAPFSGMSMNPARTFGSAFPSGIWDGLLGLPDSAAAGHADRLRVLSVANGRQAVKCCKLHHNNNKRCIFCGANGGFAS